MSPSSGQSPSPALLCVDDEPDSLEVLRYALEREYPSARVLTRPDAESGLATLAVESVDIVISDSVNLADGTPFVEAVRNDFPAVPTVLYTGKPFEAVAGILSGSGVTEYVQKGSSKRLAELLDEVGRLVETRTATTDSERETAPMFDANAPTTGAEAMIDPTDDEWTQLTRCDPTSVDELVVALVEVLGTPANDRPLSDLVDVEALSLLFDSHTASTPFHVRFSLDTHDVVITDDGVVAIRQASSA